MRVSILTFLCWGSNLIFLLFGPVIVWFSCMNRIDLVLVRGSHLTCFLCRPKMACFECGDRLTRFCVGGPESLGFSVSIELDIVFVRVVEIELI